jgi:5'-phosphate synthase pdxT subunit
MTFIRAPYIHKVLSPNVEVLSQVDDHIVAVRQGNQIATAFHPELDDPRLHQLWLEMVRSGD